MMNKVYIALGTNIEPRKKYLQQAIEQLNVLEEILLVKKSAIYETKPVGYMDQADFLNMVIEIKTSFTPIQLLDVCQSIERELGRKRTIRFGPRTIDLDILIYNHENIKSERLIVPHPRIDERAFVLVPLAEIAPHVEINEGITVEQAKENLPKEDLFGVVKFYEE